MIDFHVGSNVWILADERSRRLRTQDGQIDYDRMFIQRQIAGETSRSWIVVNDLNESVKINKADPKGIYTDDQKADYIFARKNRWKIASYVEHCDLETLKKIADLIGWKEEHNK